MVILSEQARVRSEYRFHREELNKNLSEQREVEQRVRSHRRILHALKVAYPFLHDEEEPDSPDEGVPTPRGLNAVRLILAGQRGEWMTSTEVHREMVERGWAPDTDNGAAMTRSSLNRAVKMDKIRKKRDGTRMVYRWRPAIRTSVSGTRSDDED
jgi:hypothetical protein